ncbi:hypothetical protein OAI07_00375 [Akkermansiaceae bacterium]|nr:hypothetical protein [Akkermansiaceae bacterium]
MYISRRIKWGCIAPITVIILLVVSLFVIDAVIPSEAKSALPNSAANVREYYSGTVDFVRLIKAELPQEDYVIYAANLGLTAQFNSAKHENIRRTIDMGISDAPSWWDPPNASGTTFFKYTEGDEYFQVLHYFKGTAYLVITSW